MISTALSTVLQHFRPQVGLPAAAAGNIPLALDIADLVGPRKPGQFLQGRGKNGLIAVAVVRWPKGPSDGVVDEDGPRRLNVAHDVERRADHQGRYAVRFDDVGDETDGLVAERSIRHEQRQVHRGIFQFQSKRRS